MIVICEECKSDVSDKAKTCPTCGAPLKESVLKIVLVALVYLPIYSYQEVGREGFMTTEGYKKPLKAPIESDIDFGLMFWGVIKAVYYTFVIGFVIYSILDKIIPAKRNVPMFWDIFPYSVLIVHIYIIIRIFKIYWDDI